MFTADSNIILRVIHGKKAIAQFFRERSVILYSFLIGYWFMTEIKIVYLYFWTKWIIACWVSNDIWENKWKVKNSVLSTIKIWVRYDRVWDRPIDSGVLLPVQYTADNPCKSTSELLGSRRSRQSCTIPYWQYWIWPTTRSRLAVNGPIKVCRCYLPLTFTALPLFMAIEIVSSECKSCVFVYIEIVSDRASL